MTIQEERSKRFADCIKNLYIKGMYSIEYAILQLEKFRDSNKIIESDYEEYYNYFCSEMDKKNTEKSGQNETEIVENDTVDETVDTVQDKVIEENQEEITVE